MNALVQLDGSLQPAPIVARVTRLAAGAVRNANATTMDSVMLLMEHAHVLTDTKDLCNVTLKLKLYSIDILPLP